MSNTSTSIRLTTPLGRAVGALLARLQPQLQGCPAGSVKIVIFGGCALHLLTRARVSMDIDAEISVAETLNKDILAVYSPPEGYEDDSGRDLQVYLDQNYNTTLGPLHEDYRDRAIPVEGFEGESPLHIYVVSGVDLAISKLGRFDRADIEQLIDCGQVDVRELNRLGREAIDYAVGDKRTAWLP